MPVMSTRNLYKKQIGEKTAALATEMYRSEYRELAQKLFIAERFRRMSSERVREFIARAPEIIQRLPVASSGSNRSLPAHERENSILQMLDSSDAYDEAVFWSEHLGDPAADRPMAGKRWIFIETKSLARAVVRAKERGQLNTDDSSAARDAILKHFVPRAIPPQLEQDCQCLVLYLGGCTQKTLSNQFPVSVATLKKRLREFASFINFEMPDRRGRPSTK
jgi:hypothetical protein